MMAMTIFLGSTPAWALSLRVQGFGRSRFAHFGAKLRFAQQCRCHESSAVPVRPVGRKCLETRTVCRVAACWLRPFVKRRTNPAQVCPIFNQATSRTGCPGRTPARQRPRAFAGGPSNPGPAPPGNALGPTAGGGSRPYRLALALLQRFAVLGQIEAFDLVLLAHPQRQEESDRLEENVGQHAGPDEDGDDGVELDQHLPRIAL